MTKILKHYAWAFWMCFSIGLLFDTAWNDWRFWVITFPTMLLNEFLNNKNS